MATRVPDAITPRELNNIVREGIKNPMVCTHVAYRIYSDDANAPWEATFEAVSKFLTFHRQKGIDPYGEAHGGPLVGHTSVAANSAQFGGEFKGSAAKRSMTPSRDGNGRFHKSQKTSSTETYSQSKRTSSTSHSTPTPDKSKPRNEAVCTRCWKTNTGHNFRNCPETKCICGQPLVADQPTVSVSITIITRLMRNLPTQFRKLSRESWKPISVAPPEQHRHPDRRPLITRRSP